MLIPVLLASLARNPGLAGLAKFTVHRITSQAVDSVPKNSENFGIESTACEVQQPERPIQGQTGSGTRQNLDSIPEFPENVGIESTA